jgi:hypothetical protein
MDWGGSNHQLLLNPDEHYHPEQLRDRDEFGDIRVFFCFGCWKYLNEVIDEAGMAWDDDYKLHKAAQEEV